MGVWRVACVAILMSSSGNALAQDQIPAQYQTSNQQALDVMNAQKAEMCSPPSAEMRLTCEQMEQGRQMLIASMRGEASPPMSATVASSAPSQAQMVSMLRDQVDQACGAEGDRELCDASKKNLALAQSMQADSAASGTPARRGPRPDAPIRSRTGHPDRAGGGGPRPDEPIRSRTGHPDRAGGGGPQPDEPIRSRTGHPDRAGGGGPQPDEPIRSRPTKP